MIDGSRILVVVPARGGSKGVPLKNLQPVKGVPLIAIVGDLVSTLDWVDRAVVSTDHDEIAACAEEAGLEAPFRRPESLSGDRIGDLEVLTQALEAVEADDGTTYDIVVMLQPTSPLRRVGHVEETVRKCIAEGRDAVWTVSLTDSKNHPFKQLIIGEDGSMDFFDGRGRDIIARQQLNPVYHRNGAAYAVSRACLLGQKALLGANTAAVIIDEPMVSIDTREDFAKVEAVLDAREGAPTA